MIKEASILLEKSEASINWVDMEKGYKISLIGGGGGYLIAGYDLSVALVVLFV